MSAIAQIMAARGDTVLGSDRDFDRSVNLALAEKLRRQGIRLAAQDGSGVNRTVRELVVSSAVEPAIPDVKAALALGIPVTHRAELLARIFNSSDGIAVGGTSGKSTVTGMIGHILSRCDRQPTIINGGIMIDAENESAVGNAVCGSPDEMVIEADESDGSISGYTPGIAVVTNITEDHMPLDQVRALFAGFTAAASIGLVLNLDCPETMHLGHLPMKPATFSLSKPDADFFADNLELTASGTRFTVGSVPCHISLLGRHNAANALAALAACCARGLEVRQCAESLRDFRGIRRRLQAVGRVDHVTVFDDFAHNPEKIAATLTTLTAHYPRLAVMYQPHGFAPTRLAWDGLVRVFSTSLRSTDFLAFPDILYLGGTADQTINTSDLAAAVARHGIQARHFPTRAEIADWFIQHRDEVDAMLVMGARDATLPGFAASLIDRLPRDAHTPNTSAKA